MPGFADSYDTIGGDVYQNNPQMYRDEKCHGWQLYDRYCIDAFPGNISGNAETTYLYYYSPGNILFGLSPEFSIYLSLSFDEYNDYAMEKDRITHDQSSIDESSCADVLFLQGTTAQVQMYLSDTIYDGAEFTFQIIKCSDASRRIEYYASRLNDSNRKDGIEVMMLEHMVR